MRTTKLLSRLPWAISLAFTLAFACQPASENESSEGFTIIPGTGNSPPQRRLSSGGVTIDIPVTAFYDTSIASALTVAAGPSIEVTPGGEFRTPVIVRLSKRNYAFSRNAVVFVRDGDFMHSIGPLLEDGESYYFETMGFSNLDITDPGGCIGDYEWCAWQTGGTRRPQSDLPERVASQRSDCFVDARELVGMTDPITQPRCAQSGQCSARSDSEAWLVSAEVAAKLPALRDAVKSTFGPDWEVALNGGWDSSGKVHRDPHSHHYNGRAVDLGVCQRVGADCRKDWSKLPRFAVLVNAVFSGGGQITPSSDYFVQYERFGLTPGSGDHVHASLGAPSISTCLSRASAGRCGPCLVTQTCVETSDGVARCLDACGAGRTCATGCCTQGAGGGSYCAPAAVCEATGSTDIDGATYLPGEVETSACGVCPPGQFCLLFEGTATCGGGCSSNAQCGLGCCIRTTDGDGVCVGQAACSTANVCGICDSGSLCVNLDDTRSCYSSCLANSDCAVGACNELESGNSACLPEQCGGLTCGAGEQCTDWDDNNGEKCAKRCESDADCDSRCCAAPPGAGEEDTIQLCAPGQAACNPCPEGQFPLEEGGECSGRPTSCDNGEIVCSCPETHGIWCHPSCEFTNCDGSICF